jgi:LDH2 family malate/lactate/ureidoglycolate dehydrogenase
MEALSKAIEAAEAAGIAASGVVACHHLGRLGHYAEIAAARGYVLLVWVGGQGEEEPHAAPYGGRSRVIGTNPIAFGFPGNQENAVTYDFATTATAGTKILKARDRGRDLPAGCIIDRDGHPSTDPADFFAGGAHVPFGGHKGYAIALSAEWLGRILLGADRFTVAGRGTPILRHQGALFVVIRANLFAPLEIVLDASDATYARISNSMPGPGFDEVLLPGQPEARARSLSDEKGIEIDAETWAQISRLEEAL